MKRAVLVCALALTLPLIAFAQVSNLNDVLLFVLNFLNALVPILIAAAVVFFLYGLVMYVVASDDKQRSESRSIILYGIIVLTVMIAVWGLVNILVNTFGVGNATVPTGPAVPAVRTVGGGGGGAPVGGGPGGGGGGGGGGLPPPPPPGPGGV